MCRRCEYYPLDLASARVDPDMADQVLANCGCDETFSARWARMASEEREEALGSGGGEDGRTLLMCAIQGGSTGIVQQILAHDAQGVWADAVLLRGRMDLRFYASGPNSKDKTDGDDEEVECKAEMHREEAEGAMLVLRKGERVVSALEFAVGYSRHEDMVPSLRFRCVCCAPVGSDVRDAAARRCWCWKLGVVVRVKRRGC